MGWKATPRTRWLAVLASLALTACLSDMAARRDLDHAVFLYHRDLRWLRCGQAAQQLVGDLRGPFAERCGELEGQLDLEGIEILEVKMEESNEEARLRVRYTFVAAPSVTLEKVVVTERWVKEGRDWLLAEGVWPAIDSGGAASAPAAGEGEAGTGEAP